MILSRMQLHWVGVRVAVVGVPVLALLAACSGGEATPVAESETGTSLPTIQATATAAATASSEPTAASELGASTVSPTAAGTGSNSGAERATGNGRVTVDGDSYDVEPVACGWLSNAPSPRGVPLEAEAQLQRNFRLVAAARVADGFFYFELERDGDIGVVTLSVARVVPSEDTGNFVYGNERQDYRLVELDGDHVVTPEPIQALEDPSRFDSPPHDVTIDVVCATYGGILDNITELVADATGLPFQKPQFEGEGSLTLDGTAYPVATTSCDRNGGDIELTAGTADGSVTLTVQVNALASIVFVESDGERWIQDRGITIELDGDTLNSPGPIQLVDQFSRDPAAVVTFEVTCR
jgi:hypothetical protein